MLIKLYNSINNQYRTERNIVLLFMFTRIVMVIVGLVALGNFTLAGFKDSWSNWDSSYYVEIATTGYDQDYSTYPPEAPECNQGTGECQRNFAFFPVYPMTVRGLSAFTSLSPEISGFLISNLCLLISALLLYQLGKSYFSERTAELASYVVLVFPTSYIFSAVMTEAMFMCLLLAAYRALNKKQYLLAGLLGLVLSATRNTGVLFAGVIVLHYFASFDFKWKAIRSELKHPRLDVLVSIFLVPLGLLAFMSFLDGRTGDPLAFLNIQRYWEKPVLGLNPIVAIPFSFIDFRLEGLLIHLYNLCYLALLAMLAFIGIRKQVLPMAMVFILSWILVPLTAGTMLALPRYMSVLFPFYFVIAFLLTKIKNSRIQYLLLAGSMSVLFSLTYIYTRGNWITV